MRSRQRYKRSFSATAKSVSSNSAMAVGSNHCRCSRNSLPGSIRRLTTSRRSTFSQGTVSRWTWLDNFSSQNAWSSSWRHSTPQPAVAKHPRPAQFHLAEFHLDTGAGFGRNLPIFRKQTQGRVPLAALVEHLQALAPRRFLAVVDLTQIEDRSLGHPLLLFRSYATVLHDAEIAMLLAVLLPHLGAEKHGGGQDGRNRAGGEEGRSALHAVPRLWITSHVADKTVATIPARNVRAGWTLLRKSG